MDYSSMSDDELLKLYNSSKNTAVEKTNSVDYSSMSDEELLNLYNSTKPKGQVVKQDNSIQNQNAGKNNIAMMKNQMQSKIQPVYELKTQAKKLDNNFKTNALNNIKSKYHSGFQKFQEGYQKLGRNIPFAGKWWFGSKEEADFLKTHNDMNTPTIEELEEQYNNGLIDVNQFKQQADIRTKLDNYKADRQYRNARNKAIGKGTFEIGTSVIPLGNARIAGMVAPKIAKFASKPIANITTHSLAGGAEAGAFGALDYGVNNLLGIENENSLTKNIRNYALFGLGLGGAFGSAGEVAKAVSKTKVANEIADGLRKYTDNHPAIADLIVGAKNFLTTDRTFQGKKDNLAKLEQLNELTSKQLAHTPQQLQQIKTANDVTQDEFNTIVNNLKYGSDVTKETKARVLQEGLQDGRINFNTLTPEQQTQFLDGVDTINKHSFELFGKPAQSLNENEFATLTNNLENSYAPKSVNTSNTKEIVNNINNYTPEQRVQITDDLALKQKTAIAQLEQDPYEMTSLKMFGKSVRDLSDDEFIALDEYFNKLNASKSNLSYVDNKGSSNLPENDLTYVKSDSRMADGLSEDEIKRQKRIEANKRFRQEQENKPLHLNNKAQEAKKELWQNQKQKELDELFKNPKIAKMQKETVENINKQADIAIKNKVRKASLQNKSSAKDDEWKITKLESGKAEGADWNSAGVDNKAFENNGLNVDELKDKNLVGNTHDFDGEISSSKRFIKDDPEFIKFCERYFNPDLPDKVKKGLLEVKIKKIKKEKGVRGVEEFYNDLIKQSEHNIELQKPRVIGDETIYEKNLDESSSDVALDFAKSVKKQNIDVKDITTQKIEFSPRTNRLAENELRKIIPSKLYDKFKDSQKSFEALFNSYNAKDGKKVNELYSKYKKQIELSLKMSKTKQAMLAKLNNAVENYEQKTGIKIKTTKGSSIDKINANRIYDNINKHFEDGKYNNVQDLLRDNKYLLKKELGQEKVGEIYSKLALNTEKEIDNLLKQGKIDEARALFNRNESILKNHYTNHDIKAQKEWIEGETSAHGKFEKTGDTWDKNISNVDEKQSAWVKKQAEFERKVNEARDVESVHNFFSNNGKIEKDTKIKLSKLAQRDKKYEQFADLPEMDIDIRTRTANRRYADGIESKNGIAIMSDIKNQEEVFFHETQHHIDRFVRENSPKNSRYWALEESRAKRTKELEDFLNMGDNNEKIKNIAREWKQLRQLGNTDEQIEQILSKNKVDFVREYKKYDRRYRNCYYEYRANKAGEKKLLNKKEFYNAKEKSNTKFSFDERGNRQFSEYGFRQTNDRIENQLINRRGKGKIDKSGEGQQSVKHPYEIYRKDKKGISSYHYLPDENLSISDTLKANKKYFTSQRQKDTFKTLVKYSTQDEKTLIDLGILAPEQAENRLKQNSIFRNTDGIYFKQMPIKSADGKIDLTKDYNFSKDSKIGLWGRKKADGVSIRGNAKQLTENMINRHIRINHIKNVSDLIENAFAESMEGGLRKGYVAVNKARLNSMMFGKFTKDWYKTMSMGEEAIKKAFKDEKVAQYWIDFAKRTQKADFQIPESVFNKLIDGSGETARDYWQRYANQSFFNKIKGIGHYTGAVNDALLNGFKKRVLTTGSFFVNNRIGNQMMIAMNSDNPIEYLKSVKGLKFKDDDLPAEIIQNSLLEAVSDINVRRKFTGNNAVDNALNLFNGHLIDTKELTGIKKATATGANIVVGLPNKAFTSLSDKMMKFNQTFEDFERKQVFSQIVDKKRKELIKTTGQKMIKDEEVLKYINSDSEIYGLVVKEIEDTLGDYRNFSPLEKKVLKRIIPFYSWLRTITRHSINAFKTNPERMALTMLELQKIHEENIDKKEYQRYAIPLPFEDSRSSKQLMINKGHAIPYLTFREAREDLGVNPYYKTIKEALQGHKDFLNGEITNSRYSKQGYRWNAKEKRYDSAYFDVRKNDWVRDKNGNVKIDESTKFGALPLSTRFGYIGKNVLVNTVAPFLNNSTFNLEQQSGIYFNRNKKGSEKLIPFDRNYDASFGGFNHNDVIGIKNDKVLKRFAGNNISNIAKVANYFGLSVQNKGELNKKEKAKMLDKKRK